MSTPFSINLVAPDAGRNDRSREGIRQHVRVERRVTASIGEQPAGVVMAPPEVAQFVENRLWQRHQPLLVALADNTQHQVGPVNRADLKPGGLADAQAAGIHDGKACPVDRVMNATKQMPNLVIRERLRQPLLTGGDNLFSPNNPHARSSVWQ